MANKSDKSTLGYLGRDFQLQLVKCFFEDRKFFINLVSIIDQNLFTDESLRTIVGFLKERYEAKNVVATYGEMKILINTKITSAIRQQQCLETVELIENMKFDGLDIVEGESEKFFKQQNITRAINKAQEIIKKGDFNAYYTIEDMFKKALEVNNKQECGFKLFDNVESDLRENYRETITTGCPEIDEALSGGLGRGELGIIVAPSNVGKTSICTGIACAAAGHRCEANNYKGFKVLHFFFEDKEEDIRRKYYGNMLDLDAMYLSQPDNRDFAIEKLKEMSVTNSEYRDNVRLERLLSGETTASDIRRKVDTFIARGFIPDLVIIDYFECLRGERDSSKTDSEWAREGVTMRVLESICNEKGVAMWVPVQGTKGSLGAEFVGLMHAGGSVAKIQIGHVVITLSRTDEQKSQGRLNVYIQKLRAVKIKNDKFINVKFNNGTGKFDMSDRGDDDAFFTERSQNVSVAVNALNRQRT